MKSFLLLVFFLAFVARPAHAQEKTATPFYLLVFKKNDSIAQRSGNFIAGIAEPTKKEIHCSEPGLSGHLTVLLKDELRIVGASDSISKRLKTPGSYVYIFENTDLI